MEYVGRFIKLLLKFLIVTVIIGLIAFIGRSLYNLWKGRRG